MTKFQVVHFMGHQPPHPKAIQEDDLYTFSLTVEGLMTLAEDYDLMIRKLEDKDRLPVLSLDDKGRRFRTR